MRPPGPGILGVPVAVLGNIVGLSPWLAGFVAAASLILGLAHAIIPQNSADRLNLLLALRRNRNRSTIGDGHHCYSCKSYPACRHADSQRVTVVGQLVDSQEQ
jgi:hypothetical protein